jgi:hypothetical protein
MAIASPQAEASSATARPPRTALRLLPAAVTVVAVAVLLELVYDRFLNYDARYALVWARDLARGLKPDYEADFAPTPHPLETVASIVATPFHSGADTLLVWVTLLCFGLVVWLTYRLGAVLFTPWAGVVAALAVLTRPALERDALLGYQDTAFAALILGAVLLEAKQRRRGAPVLALLVVAGLMRPEAWVLGGLYVLWMWPAVDLRGRVRLVALAALAPLLWAALDWYVTGDPLHSLHGTADLAEAVDRRRHPEQAPYWTLQYFGHALREPLVVGIPIGLYFAWRHRYHRALLPLAAVAALTVVFMLGPVFGLPLIGRYVRTPSVLLALFYGLAVCGWMLLEPGRERRLWMYVGGFAVALSVIFIPWHARMIGNMRENMSERTAVYADLRAAGRAPPVRAAFAACGSTISASDHRPMPHLRWWLNAPPFSVSTIEAGTSPLQPLLFAPRDVPAMRRFYSGAYERMTPPPGYRTVYRNASWRVLAAPRCFGPLATTRAAGSAGGR